MRSFKFNIFNNYVCALDIGSSKIAAVLAEIEKRSISNIYFESMQSEGIRQGSVVDSIELVNAVSSLLKKLRAKSGINIKFVYTNVSGQDIITKHARAVIPLAERGNKVITLSDIEKVNDQARVLGSSLEDEIIHLIPHSYGLDSKQDIINPLGLYSHSLEADLYLVCVKLSCVQNLSRVINQAGYEIKELFFSGLATSRAALDKESQEGFNLFCDIGSDITELLLFKNGRLWDVQILPVGGNNMTAELQSKLKVPFALAEEIKRSHGIIGSLDEIKQDKEILIKDNDFYKPIKQRAVLEIITPSAKSICNVIKEAIENKLPACEINNLIIAGDCVLLEGFIETLENTLNMPVEFARIENQAIPASVKELRELSGRKYLTYLTCLGMLCEVLRDRTELIISKHKPSFNPVLNAVNKFKELYQEYF
jgi:cell division protein FtsA